MIMKILLVDDFEMVRVMLRNILQGLGYRNVEEAENGQAALKKINDAQAKGQPFNMVFCDWNMPVMSGIDLVEACQADPLLKALPFIMLTAQAEKAQIIRAIKAGATDYIIKPVSPEMLQAKINRLVEQLKQKSA
jgi:two-component system, chemotaxis family, chemotaxis protein CheY